MPNENTYYIKFQFIAALNGLFFWQTACFKVSMLQLTAIKILNFMINCLNLNPNSEPPRGIISASPAWKPFQTFKYKLEMRAPFCGQVPQWPWIGINNWSLASWYKKNPLDYYFLTLWSPVQIKLIIASYFLRPRSINFYLILWDSCISSVFFSLRSLRVQIFKT